MEENKNQEVVEETVEETVEPEAQAEEVVEEPTKEKPKKSKKKKDERDEKIEELSDKLLRQMAEFDNFRKRTEKEKSAMYEIGAKDIIEKLLPVVDNFERGFTTVEAEDENDPLVYGMKVRESAPFGYSQMIKNLLNTIGLLSFLLLFLQGILLFP